MIDARAALLSAPSVLLINADTRRYAFRCGHCGGDGMSHAKRLFVTVLCPACGGVGFFGIDPTEYTTARLGTEARLVVLSARERLRMPLHNPLDSLEYESPEFAPLFEPLGDEDEDDGDLDSVNRSVGHHEVLTAHELVLHPRNT